VQHAGWPSSQRRRIPPRRRRGLAGAGAGAAESVRANARDGAALGRLRLRRSHRLLLGPVTTVHAVAQLLAGAEEDSPLGLDRDHFSGLGVTPVVPLVVLDVESAETADFDVVALAQGRFHRLEDRLDGELRLLLR